MKRRDIAGAGLSVLIAVACLTQAPVGGQAPPGASGTQPQTKKWTLPRTPWGDPDLSGVWANATTTSWQRPMEYGTTKTFYTDDEIAIRDRILGPDSAGGGSYGEESRQVLAALKAASSGAAGGRGNPAGGDGTGGSPSEFYERGLTVRTKQTSLIIDPPNGRLPPLTPEAQKRMADLAAARKTHGPSDSYLDRDLPERCLQYRGLPPVPSGQNNDYAIVQTPEYVAILQEHIHETRIIPLDGRPHVSPNVRQWLGDSRGHWEGDTLVVDTTNFYGFDKFYFRIRASIEVTDGYHIVERFTRVGATPENTPKTQAPLGDMIDYRFTVDDPKTFTQSFTGSLPMTKMEGVKALFFESACHEGNHGMINILEAARAEEKAADTGKKPQ